MLFYWQRFQPGFTVSRLTKVLAYTDDSCADIGISMGYLYLMMVNGPFAVITLSSLTAGQGVIISSAVLPAVLTLMWNKQNIFAVALSPILGLCCSLIGAFNCRRHKIQKMKRLKQ